MKALCSFVLALSLATGCGAPGGAEARDALVDLETALDARSEADTETASDATGDRAEGAVDAGTDGGDGGAATDGGDGGAGTVPQRSCPDPSERGCGAVRLSGGTFALGEASPSRFAAPVQPRITVSPFALDAYEVTVARFRRFWAAGHPSPSPSVVPYPGGALRWEGAVEPESALGSFTYCTWSATPGAREAHPINCVDWATAQAFCVWDGGRLPTEAEWEWAARGRHGAPYRAYPWGDDHPRGAITSPCDRAQWNDCAGDDRAPTRRVGSFAPSGGVFDQAGNVWEWTADWYDDYASDRCWSLLARTDPVCSDATSGERVVRGGAWLGSEMAWLRAASRTTAVPVGRGDETGFRCARAPGP